MASTYLCKNCREVITEFDIVFERELKGAVSPKNCFCKTCNLKEQPAPLIEHSLACRLKEIFQGYGLWLYQLIVFGLMALIAFGGKEMLFDLNEKWGFSESAVDFILVFVLFVFALLAYFSYWNYRDIAKSSFYEYDTAERFIALLLKYSYPIFIVCIMLSYILPDNENHFLFVINRIYCIPFGIVALVSIVAFFYSWFKAGSGGLQSMTVVDTYYVSTYSNGTITTRKENEYSGDSGLFIAFTYPWWSIFYWIIKSIVVSIKYLIHIRRFADKKVVQAYRKAQKTHPQVYFDKIEWYQKKLLKREDKINKIKWKYGAYGDRAVEKAITKIKEQPLPKEKVRGVLYYNLKRINQKEIIACYQKDGKEINVTFIDGQRVYDDLE